MRALVTRIDHVFVPLADAAAAFRFLCDALALPAAWPFGEYGLFASGGITLGAANLEVVRTSDVFPFFVAQRPARVQGIAFAPVPIDDDFVAELDRRGIGHSGVLPSDEETTGRLWTNVFFSGVVDGR